MYIAPQDSFVAQELREAGAVILGKTNLSEWANFHSDYSSSGWISRGGQTKNPYALDRNPCGSSSGSAVAVAAKLAFAFGQAARVRRPPQFITTVDLIA
jgi:amidase